MMKWLRLFPALVFPPLQAAGGAVLLLYLGSLLFELWAGDAETFLDPSKVASIVIRDRHGTVLRNSPSEATGSRATWVKPSQVSPHFIHAVIAAEDKRFYDHGGIDPLAVVRAAAQNVAAGKIVSGGSTITQQVVKTATGGATKRTLVRKLLEAAGALYLERTLSKKRILESYVNWVPFGNLARGVEAASRLYFDKPSAHLTLSEAAALAALLRAPSAMNPYTHPGKLETRRAWILDRMLEQGMIGREEHDYALANAPAYARPSHPFLAPHLVDEVLEKAGEESFAAGEITTTIDQALQDEAEHLADKMIAKVRHLDITNAAVIVIDNRSDEILAYVGSSSYFDREREGMNDGVMALRSPGSTLKPFIYAAAFESGGHPSKVIADVETVFSTPIGIYKPRNYDGLYHGPVRMREALGSSYNVPAVKLASELGPSRVLDILHAAGMASLSKSPDHYGVAIAVGDGDVTLFELASAYAALARGGLWKAPTFVKAAKDAEGRTIALPAPFEKRVIGPQAAFLVSDILSDPAARTPAFGKAEIFDFPFPVAVKTGTSSDYRDNWTVGYSSEVTVGVWVGNFSGKPMGNVSGITGAGPLFHQVMKAAMKGRTGKDFPKPAGIVVRKVCALSGELAGPGCPDAYDEVFIEGSAPAEACAWHTAGKNGTVLVHYPPELQPWAAFVGKYDPAAYGDGGGEPPSGGAPVITAPRDGATFVVDPDVPAALQKLKVAVAGGAEGETLRLIVDGKPVAKTQGPHVFLWTLEKGGHTMAVEGKGGASPPVTFEVY
jgi:penicillin-binding protein 1C